MTTRISKKRETALIEINKRIREKQIIKYPRVQHQDITDYIIITVADRMRLDAVQLFQIYYGMWKLTNLNEVHQKINESAVLSN